MTTAVGLFHCWVIASLAIAAPPAFAAEPVRGGSLTYAVAAEPPTYDCHAANTFAVLHHVAPHYSTLLKFEAGNYPNIVGDVAESWTVSPDNLVYTFKLQPNVRFHDGTQLTSADVKANYERLRAPPPGITSFRQPSFALIDTIETPDRLTVVFRMKAVDSSILYTFASPWNCLYSAAKLQADPNFPAKNVMGSGPFKFVEHVAGSHWNGARFEQYFRAGHPYLDGFRTVTMNAGATLNALEGRQVLAEFRGFSPAERDRLVKAMGKAATVQEQGWLLDMIVTFNTTQKPFDDARIRRALSIAIDRWGGAKSLGRVSPLSEVGGLVRPNGTWSASEAEMTQWPGYGKNMEANRAEARRLLKEAGAENLTFTLTNRNIEPYTTTGIFLIDQWRQIGVKAEHKQLELAAWTSSIYGGGGFDVIVDSFTDFADDPTSALVKYISSDRSPVSAARFTDRTLDDLYNRQIHEVNKDPRMKLIRQFETRLFEQSYAVPLLWWKRIVVVNTRVQGWTMSPSHMIYQDLGDVWLAPDEN